MHALDAQAQIAMLLVVCLNQGTVTVLGPLLFLILMSDIDEDIVNSKIISFADDTRLYNSVSEVVLFQNRHNIQYIAFLGIYSSVLYSLKGSIENRFFKFFAHIFFLNADYNIFT